MLGSSPCGGRDGNKVHPLDICGVRLETGSGTKLDAELQHVSLIYRYDFCSMLGSVRDMSWAIGPSLRDCSVRRGLLPFLVSNRYRQRGCWPIYKVFSRGLSRVRALVQHPCLPPPSVSHSFVTFLQDDCAVYRPLGPVGHGCRPGSWQGDGRNSSQDELAEVLWFGLVHHGQRRGHDR